MEIFGLENVKPFAESFIQPFFSMKVDVATLVFPSVLVIETLAFIGALVNL